LYPLSQKISTGDSVKTCARTLRSSTRKRQTEKESEYFGMQKCGIEAGAVDDLQRVDDFLKSRVYHILQYRLYPCIPPLYASKRKGNTQRGHWQRQE
jgi:hypothetical protein